MHILSGRRYDQKAGILNMHCVVPERGVSSLKLHVHERVTFSGKNTIQKGKYNDLRAEPPGAIHG